MKLKATKFELKQTFDGDMELTLHISKESIYSVRQMRQEEELKGELTVDIKKYVKHRTINQNDFLWSIETKLANYYNKSVNEIHRTNLIAYGVPFGQATMKYEKAEEFCKTNYARIEKEKTQDGIRIALFTLFKGSSEMNTKEFSKLVNAILEECQSCGIEIEQDKENFKSLIKQMEKKNVKI